MWGWLLSSILTDTGHKGPQFGSSRSLKSAKEGLLHTQLNRPAGYYKTHAETGLHTATLSSPAMRSDTRNWTPRHGDLPAPVVRRFAFLQSTEDRIHLAHVSRRSYHPLQQLWKPSFWVSLQGRIKNMTHAAARCQPGERQAHKHV